MTDDLRERVARVMAKIDFLREQSRGFIGQTRTFDDDWIASKHYEMADAAIAEMGGVRVKPLEWQKGTITTTDDDGGPREGVRRRLHAWQGNGFTIIQQDGSDGLFILRNPHGNGSVWPSLDQAKDEAARILAAVKPAPDNVQEAARVLLGDDFNSPMLEALDPFNNSQDVAQDVLEALRALAEGQDND